MNRNRKASDGRLPTVMVDKKPTEYLERRQVLRRDYFLLEHVGNPSRENYKAFDPLCKRFFLVQSLPLNKSTDQLLKAMRRLNNESFPRIVEWQKHEDHIDVASNWIDGPNLGEYLQNIRNGERRVDPSFAVRLVNGLVHAVSHLHLHMQVTHGDIQPRNVIVSSRPSRLHLIDFGSAWTIDWTTQRTEGDGHHRCYAAPELQSGNTVVSPACDVFSLSVLLFELLTTELPYDGIGGKAGRPEHISKAGKSLVPPSQVSESCRKLPRSIRDKLDDVVLRGLSFDPDVRFTNHTAWKKEWDQLTWEFRSKPAMTPGLTWVTNIVEWMSRRLDSSRTNKKERQGD